MSSNIITSFSAVREVGLREYAWSALKRYHDVSYVTDLLAKRHLTNKNQKRNVQKQANQLRYCLIQAREYLDASQAASLATRPLLLYYCAMSLALAEILKKQDGRSSLDQMRQHHGHHGLEFSISSSKDRGTLERAAGGLIAMPRNGQKRAGTFEIWHRTARYAPQIGKRTDVLPGNLQTYGPRVLFAAADQRMKLLPSTGITLLECMKYLRGMADVLTSFNVEIGLVRGQVEQFMYQDNPERQEIYLILHPDRRDKLERLISQIFVAPSGVNYVYFQEYPSGYRVTFRRNTTIPDYIIFLPEGYNVTENTIYFFDKEIPLNEFGLIYVALFICGIYARYYPDLWMSDIDRNLPLVNAVETLLDVAEERLPVLALNELSDTIHLAIPHL